MDDNRFLTLFQKYKYTLFLGIGLLILVTVLAVRWGPSKEGEVERDYLYARQLAAEMAGNLKGVAVTDFEGIVSRHKELQAQYDGRIAQYWMKEGHPEAAEPYVKRIAHRIGKQAPHYTELAHASLLAGEEALKETQRLRLAVSEKEYPLLATYLTLRTALLQEELGRAEAQGSWHELILLLEAHPKETRPFQAAMREGRVSLLDYAKSRLSS
ncbi:MAG: hypothetical protein AB7F31_00080 [Parachlamydiales bacterium]